VILHRFSHGLRAGRMFSTHSLPGWKLAMSRMPLTHLTPLVVFLAGCSIQTPRRTEILWDTWGIPHIYAPTADRSTPPPGGERDAGGLEDSGRNRG